MGCSRVLSTLRSYCVLMGFIDRAMRARLPFEFILTDAEICELTGAPSSAELRELKNLSLIVRRCCLRGLHLAVSF